MSRSINKHCILGHVGSDPEIRVTASGTRLAKFSVATNRRIKQQDGSYQEEANWHRITAWGKLVDVCQNFGKGARVYIEGESITSQYEGKYYTEVHVQELIVISGWVGGGNHGGGESAPAQRAPSSGGSGKSAPKSRPKSGRASEPDDDLPF